MSDINLPVSVTNVSVNGLLSLIEGLREIADHLERYGLAAYHSGGLVLGVENDVEVPYTGRRENTGRLYLSLSGSIMLHAVVPLGAAPPTGLREWPACAGHPTLRWNGEPQRPPRKNEWCMDKGRFIRPCRTLKKPRWIYEECS